MNFEEVANKALELAENLRQECQLTSAEACGLDRRSSPVHIGNDFIMSEYPGSIDYYGGFEYVDSEHVITLGPYKIYSAESDRVRNAVESAQNNAAPCDDKTQYLK